MLSGISLNTSEYMGMASSPGFGGMIWRIVVVIVGISGADQLKHFWFRPIRLILCSRWCFLLEPDARL